MSVFDIFSKRKKKNELSGKVDVFIYDEIPNEFRVQVIHIWEEAIGPFFDHGEFDFDRRVENNDAWITIVKILSKELGVFRLGNEYSNPKKQCIEFIQQAKADHVLDIVELSFKIIDRQIRRMNQYEQKQHGISQDPDNAISELNHRFFEHGLGYQYQNGEIIRVDSQYIHEEVVKTALTLIHEEGFQGAEDEFRKAHEHYRHGRSKEALNEALKALESTAKSICSERKWTYASNATAKVLIDVIFQNGLIVPELQSHFTALRSVLESGVPTIRNKQGGHGQGLTVKVVPEHLVGFILHSSASAIVFLIQAHREK